MSQAVFITPKSGFRRNKITVADIPTPTTIVIIITGFTNIISNSIILGIKRKEFRL